MEKKGPIRTKVAFNGELYKSDGWVCLDIPQNVSAMLGRRGRVPVTGTINGFPIRNSLFPTGAGGHFMMVNKEMHRGASVGVGDRVEVILEVDTSPRVLKVPEDLSQALSQHPEARASFESLSYSHKKEYVDWIEDAKQSETRARRIEETVAKLTKDKKLK